MIRLPRLYAILDPACFHGDQWFTAAKELVAAGVLLLQYRNKFGTSREIFGQAQALRTQLDRSVKLIMNDRADLALATEFDGVHVGQDDLSAEGARKVIRGDLWLGVSTHSPAQVEAVNRTSADYVAIGPVFSTVSKTNPDPVVGLEGVKKARSLTAKPLVAIGGITRENCHSVLDVGADSVAVISDLMKEPKKSAEEFLRILG